MSDPSMSSHVVYLIPDTIAEIIKHTDLKSLSACSLLSKYVHSLAKERLLASLIQSYRKGEIDNDCLYIFVHSSSDHDFRFLLSQIMNCSTPKQIGNGLTGLTYSEQRNLFLSVCRWDRQNDIDAFIEDSWPCCEHYRHLSVFLFEFGCWVDAILLEEAVISSQESDESLNSQLDRMITEFTNEMLMEGKTIPEIGNMISLIRTQYPFIIDLYNSEIYNPNRITSIDEYKLAQKRDSIAKACRVLWRDL